MGYKLVCFDLDGTIIDDVEFIWYVLHRHFNVDEAQIQKWHRWFDNGKISYDEWFAQDVRWWDKAGARKEDFIDAVSKLKLMPGTKDIMIELKKQGIKIAIISGSLNIVVDYFFPENPFDYVFINEIYFTDGSISDFKVTPYDFAHKAAGVRHIAKKEGFDLSECVFVGDNYNDIDAVKLAGLGISFNSKSKELDKVADIIIREKNLRLILDFL